MFRKFSKNKENQDKNLAKSTEGTLKPRPPVAREPVETSQVFSLPKILGKKKKPPIPPTINARKNRFKKPTASGYRDLNLLVRLPKTNLIAEVQLHLKAIADVKSGPEHDLYEQIQNHSAI